MERQTMGDIMAALDRSGWATLGKLILGVIYLAGVAYTGLHNWSLFKRTFPDSLETLVWITLVVTEGAAIALPIVAHYMAAPGFQRLWAWILYALDFAFIAGNTVLDGTLNRGAELSEWMVTYSYFVPAVPVVLLAGIAIYWAADPSHRLRDVLEQARVASIETLANRIRHAATEEGVNDIIEDSARALARRVAEQVAWAERGWVRNGDAVEPAPKGSAPGAVRNSSG